MRPLPLGHSGNLSAVEIILPVGGVVQQAQDVEQRRFAAARRAHDGYEFAVFHIHVDAIQGGGFYLFGREEFL